MFKYIYIYIYLYEHLPDIYYVDHLCAWYPQSPQKSALELLEQELKVGVSSVDTGNSA